MKFKIIASVIVIGIMVLVLIIKGSANSNTVVDENGQTVEQAQ